MSNRAILFDGAESVLTPDFDFDQFRIRRDAAMMHMALNELDPFLASSPCYLTQAEPKKAASTRARPRVVRTMTTKFSPLPPPAGG